MSTGKHTLVVLNPGHFHAALTLRKRHAHLNDDVHVYAEDGADLEGFLRIVTSFNERASEPTNWKLHVYRGSDFFDRLRRDRPGKVVVYAGKNDAKMRFIRDLHGDGFSVLGDKPWLIGADDLPLLRETIAGPPLAMDIMTERHEIATRVQKALLESAEVFGAFRTDDGEPAILLESVHHLYKLVNQRPLVRPAWYFDVAIQGEGITDVTTHLVDLTQWMTGRGAPFDYARDVELLAARQWPTAVGRDIFERVTGLDDFPAAVRGAVADDTLHYLCNAQIDYRLRGLPVRAVSIWNLAIPEGGGDTHCAILRGTRADLVVDQGPQTAFATRLSVHPRSPGPPYARALAQAVAALQPRFPGLAVETDGDVYRIAIPQALRTTHEEHFATVLDAFLDLLNSGEQPANLGPDLLAKYTLLARAQELSHRE